MTQNLYKNVTFDFEELIINVSPDYKNFYQNWYRKLINDVCGVCGFIWVITKNYLVNIIYICIDIQFKRILVAVIVW